MPRNSRMPADETEPRTRPLKVKTNGFCSCAGVILGIEQNTTTAKSMEMARKSGCVRREFIRILPRWGTAARTCANPFLSARRSTLHRGGKAQRVRVYIIIVLLSIANFDAWKHSAGAAMSQIDSIHG